VDWSGGSVTGNALQYNAKQEEGINMESVDAGKVDMERLIQIMNLSTAELADLKTVALIEYLYYKENNYDPFRDLKEKGYSVEDIKDYVEAFIHEKLTQGMLNSKEALASTKLL
jgi:hypothetical protein